MRSSLSTPMTPGALVELQASRGIPTLSGDFELTEHQFKTFGAEAPEASGDVAASIKKQRLTKIIGTVGPACRTPETLEKLIKAGMNIAQVQFHTDDTDYHVETIKNIKEAATAAETNVAIVVDIKGPGIKTGVIKDSEASADGFNSTITLKTGSEVLVTSDATLEEECTEETLYVDMENIADDIKEGCQILIDDGLIILKVTKDTGKGLACEVVHGGELGSRKNVSIPDVELQGGLSDKDAKDIKFAAEQELDALIVSYTQSADCITEIRSTLGEKGAYMKVFAKICDLKGVRNFMDIIQVADGVLISRGLLGNSIPAEKIFLVQKMITTTANRIGKPVIVGSQMLNSLVHKALASRPESNDVANAILDGADCLLLSNESAMNSDNLVTAIEHMASICLEADQVLFRLPVQKDIQEISKQVPNSMDTVAFAAINATYQCMASAIIVITSTGRTAFVLSAFKPRCPVIMVTRVEHIARQSLFYRAIIPALITTPPAEQWDEDMNFRIKSGIEVGVTQGVVKPKDTVIVVLGLSSGPGNTNCIQIVSYNP